MKSLSRALLKFLLCGSVAVVGCDKKPTPAPAPAAKETNTSSSQSAASQVVKDSSEASSEQIMTRDDSFETLQREYAEAVEKYRTKLQQEAEAKQQAALAELAAAEKAIKDAKTDEDKLAAQQRLQLASRFPAMQMFSPADGPGQDFSPRFLAYAIKHPGESTALEALNLVLITSGGPTGKAGTWSGAVKALRNNHLKSPELKKAVRLFRMLAGAHDDDADRWLADVIANHPDRRAQGRACQALAQGRAAAAEKGERLKSDEGFRKNFQELIGDEATEKLIAGAAAARGQAEELTKKLSEQYGDVCPDLSIGKAAPEVVSQSLDDQAVTLSALKGKVVVLDIWATWCGPCVAMIPHEREMVERLKDKPFVLVSISADEKKETLTSFLEKKPMPWTHWWNGRDGGIIEDWNVEAYPTIYVLDAKGIIRHKNLRGEKLEEAVNELLSEMEAN